MPRFSSAVLTASAFLFLLVLGRPASLGAAGVSAGDAFPDIQLPPPEAAADLADLGIPPGAPFTLRQIEGEVILVEYLNVYCPHCQRQTRPYNEVFRRVAENPGTRGRVKFLAIAVGNGKKEADDFRNLYEVPFPVLPDPRFQAHRAIGGGRTPFTLYVRQDPGGGPGVIAGTHAGTQFDTEGIFSELQGWLTTDLALLRSGSPREPRQVEVAPLLGPVELEGRLRRAFAAQGRDLLLFEQISLPSGRQVFMAELDSDKGRRRLFAEVTSRPSVCDACHDVHFFYLFDREGTVVALEPLQLTKRDNKPLDRADLNLLRTRVLGRSLVRAEPFHPEVDAVTSATITSAIIFDSLNQGESLLRELREKGLL